MKRDTFNIDVRVKDSTALQRIFYDSESELMDVTYNSGGTYTHDNIDSASFAHLVELALNEKSWGRGFYLWKKEKMSTLVTTLDQLSGDASPNDLARFDKTYLQIRQSILGKKAG